MNRPGDGNGVRSGPLQPGSQCAWPAIPFLLGIEATLLLVWHVSGFQHSPTRPDFVLGPGGLLVTPSVHRGGGWAGGCARGIPAP